MVNSVDASWCDGLRQCSEGDMFSLASEMAVVQDLDVEQCDPETAVLAVTGLLACLDRCGSTVLRALAVLESSCSDIARVGALDVLRLLPAEWQGAVCEEEVSTVAAVFAHLGDGYVPGVRVAAAFALFTLGCRNGLAAGCASLDAIEQLLVLHMTTFRALHAAQHRCEDTTCSHVLHIVG